MYEHRESRAFSLFGNKFQDWSEVGLSKIELIPPRLMTPRKSMSTTFATTQKNRPPRILNTGRTATDAFVNQQGLA